MMIEVNVFRLMCKDGFFASIGLESIISLNNMKVSLSFVSTKCFRGDPKRTSNDLPCRGLVGRPRNFIQPYLGIFVENRIFVRIIHFSGVVSMFSRI